MADFTKTTGPLAHAQHLFLKSPSRFLGPPAKMAMLLTLGVLLMASHHSLYRYLDGKPVQHNLDITGQKVTSVLGNLIAYVARTVLAAGISIAFAQLLWSHMRAKDNSITQIDALVSCQQTPFSPASFPAWSSSTVVLIAVAISGTAMSVITVFASSSLTVVSSDTAYSSGCTVGAPNLGYAHGDLGSAYTHFGKPVTLTVSHASRVVVQGSPLPPLAQCQGSCQYDIAFVAPALSCTNTTDTANFNDLLPVTSTTYTIWNSSYVFDNDNGLVIDAALSTFGPPYQAVRCKAFNSTYTARIQQTNDSTTSITVLNPPQQHEPLNYTSNGDTTWLGLDSIGVSLAEALTGTAVHQSDYGWAPGPNIMAFTWIARSAYIGTQVDLMTVLPSLMQNISLSIASGYLDVPNYYSTVTPYDSTCFYPTIRYSYNPRELLVTYGGGIFLAGICLLFGWLSQRHRRPGSTDNSLSFSRFVAAVLNKSADAPAETTTLSLTEQTRLQLLDHGQFYVVRNLGDVS